MAELNSFLKGIADAIRSKKGTTDKINASNFASEILSISGGGEVIEVDELPNNPQENVVYQVNEPYDIDVYIKTGDYKPSTLEESIKYIGATPKLTYYVVDSLPETPNISDLQTFNPAYVYICDDIAYAYGNAGTGNMWIEVKDLVSQTLNLVYENKGYVINQFNISEQGVYVTYKLGKQGIYYKEKYGLLEYNDAWLDYKSIFDKSIKKLYAPNIEFIYPYSFCCCYDLTSVDFPDALSIGLLAFADCFNLESVRFQKVVELGLPFANCDNLKDLYIGSDVVPLINSSTFDNFEGLQVHVRPELLSAYQTAGNWKNDLIDGNIILVGDYTD